MSNTIFRDDKKAISHKKRFGLCDDPPPPPTPAYLDETNGGKWIAVVENNENEEITFYPLDNCIVLKRPDNKKAKCCDAVLLYASTIIFVELKQRNARGNDWVIEGEGQLKSTIDHFKQSEEAECFDIKKAYIANSERTKPRKGWALRAERFFEETGYVLRINHHIRINEPAL